MDELWTEMSPESLEIRIASGDPPIVLDVRTAPEVAAYHIGGVVWISLDELVERYGELEPDRETVLVCEHGIRSVTACRFLHAKGFRRLGNLTGGMSGWNGPVETGLKFEDRPHPESLGARSHAGDGHGG